MKISVGNYPVIVGKGLWGLPGTGYGRLLDTFRTARETLAETAEVRLFGMHTRVTCRIEISQEKVAHPPKGSPPQAGDPRVRDGRTSRRVAVAKWIYTPKQTCVTVATASRMGCE